MQPILRRVLAFLTPTRERSRRLSRILGAVGLLSIGIPVTAYFYEFSYYGERFDVEIDRGKLWIDVVYYVSSEDALETRKFWSFAPEGFVWGRRQRFERFKFSGARFGTNRLRALFVDGWVCDAYVGIPVVWIPAGLILVSGVLAAFGRYGSIEGHCRRCRYCLFGCVSPRCPECGTRIPATERLARLRATRGVLSASRVAENAVQ